MRSKEILSIKQLPKSLLVILLAGIVSSCATSEQNVEEDMPGNASNEVLITNKQFESSNMKLGSLEEKVFSSTVHTIGMIDVPPENKASVSTYYGGFVEKINLLPGQKVNKGQMLFTLANPEYVQMQQDFLETQSKLSYLKSDYERQLTLAKDNIASRKNFLKAETEYNVALAIYESLKKKLILININPATISYKNLKTVIVIYAPITGYITIVKATKGMYLNPTDVAVELVDSDHIHLELNVFEKDIQKVKVGQPISFQLPDADGQWYDAEVHLVGKTVEGENRTVNVHGHLKDESIASLFVPGMYVEAKIAIENEKAVALPEEAVVNVGNTYYVLVKRGKNATGQSFIKREVQLGKTQSKLVEIKNAGDFNSTDQILFKGAFNLIN